MSSVRRRRYGSSDQSPRSAARIARQVGAAGEGGKLKNHQRQHTHWLQHLPHSQITEVYNGKWEAEDGASRASESKIKRWRGLAGGRNWRFTWRRGRC